VIERLCEKRKKKEKGGQERFLPQKMPEINLKKNQEIYFSI
jgi:hypothetical protein